MRPIVLIAVVIVGLAIVTSNSAGLMRSVEHGFGWSLGREISHSLVHGRF